MTIDTTPAGIAAALNSARTWIGVMDVDLYIAENYGFCAKKHCDCRCTQPNHPQCGKIWLGTRCKDWMPANATTYAELGKWQQTAQEQTK